MTANSLCIWKMAFIQFKWLNSVRHSGSNVNIKTQLEDIRRQRDLSKTTKTRSIIEVHESHTLQVSKSTNKLPTSLVKGKQSILARSDQSPLASKAGFCCPPTLASWGNTANVNCPNAIWPSQMVRGPAKIPNAPHMITSHVAITRRADISYNPFILFSFRNRTLSFNLLIPKAVLGPEISEYFHSLWKLSGLHLASGYLPPSFNKVCPVTLHWTLWSAQCPAFTFPSLEA